MSHPHVVMPGGIQHVLFAYGPRHPQMRVTGAPLLDSVYLYPANSVLPEHRGVQIRSWHCFEDLRRTGKLPQSYFSPDANTRRLREVL